MDNTETALKADLGSVSSTYNALQDWAKQEFRVITTPANDAFQGGAGSIKSSSIPPEQTNLSALKASLGEPQDTYDGLQEWFKHEFAVSLYPDLAKTAEGTSSAAQLNAALGGPESTYRGMEKWFKDELAAELYPNIAKIALEKSNVGSLNATLGSPDDTYRGLEDWFKHDLAEEIFPEISRIAKPNEQ